MRKLVVYTLVTLDGVAESPERFAREFDDVMFANLARVIGSQDAVLLGRTQYDEWAPHWPDSDTEPFAGFVNGVRKYVVTASPPDVEWANTTVVDGDAAEFVRDLKNGPGGDIGVHGSLTLARSLLAAGLVDEISLVVFPTTAGRGARLFTGDDPSLHLELLRVVGAPSGALLLDYRVKNAPPTT